MLKVYNYDWMWNLKEKQQGINFLEIKCRPKNHWDKMDLVLFFQVLFR
jgi:hypothetical protein